MAFVGTKVSQKILEKRRIAEANTCVMNLKQIDGAVHGWALEFKKSDGDKPPSESVLYGPRGYISKSPLVCPSGGSYVIREIGINPFCTLGTNARPPHILPQ